MVKIVACSSFVNDFISCNEVNRLTPNDPYSGRTALLTSKRCILYIYSTNTGTEYFKLGVMKRNFGINFWKKKRYARTRKTY